MKNYLKIIITFFLLILLYIVIDVGFNFNQEKQFFNDKNSVNINLYRNKSTYNKFINYINNFSRKNDVIITKQIYANHNTQIFSSNPTIKVSQKPFVWSNNQWISTYDTTEIGTIGYNGSYRFSKDGMQNSFCKGVAKEGLGKCVIAPITKATIVTYVGTNYWIILTAMAISVFGMHLYLLSNNKKEIAFRKISGESFSMVYWRIFDKNLFLYFIVNIIIMVLLLLINSLITKNMSAFLNMLGYYLAAIAIVFILILVFRWLMLRFFYKNIQKSSVSMEYNKKEYNVLAIILNALKFLLLLLLIAVGTKQVMMLKQFHQTIKDAKVFKNHQEIYTFDVNYKGHLAQSNAKLFDKHAASFYKDLTRHQKIYLVDASGLIDNKHESDCEVHYNYRCNGVLVNENYLNDFTNFKVKDNNVLNVFVNKQKKVDSKQLIKDIKKNMDLDGVKRHYSLHYYDENIKLLTLDQRAYQVKNPIILVDNMHYHNQMYGSLATRGHNLFFETSSAKPFNYIKNYVQTHRLENEILGVYKPFSKITQKQRQLDKNMEEYFAIIVLGLLALMVIIYDNIKLLFDYNHSKFLLNTIHGVPSYYLLKYFYIFNIIFAALIGIISSVLHLNILIAVIVIFLYLLMTYVMSQIIKNKNVKGELT